MKKYFVQSGTMRHIVEAESMRKAAIWAVHQAMQQIVPIEPDNDRSIATKEARLTSEGTTVLSSQVVVSERGYDQPDASRMNTMEVINQWNEMVMALDRLQQMLHRAA